MKEKLPIDFITNFVSKGWDEVGNLKASSEAIKREFKDTSDIANIIQDLIDAYLVALGQMELHLDKKDYLDIPTEKELKESLTEAKTKLPIFRIEDKYFEENTNPEIDIPQILDKYFEKASRKRHCCIQNAALANIIIEDSNSKQQYRVVPNEISIYTYVQGDPIYKSDVDEAAGYAFEDFLKKITPMKFTIKSYDFLDWDSIKDLDESLTEAKVDRITVYPNIKIYPKSKLAKELCSKLDKKSMPNIVSPDTDWRIYKITNNGELTFTAPGEVIKLGPDYGSLNEYIRVNVSKLDFIKSHNILSEKDIIKNLSKAIGEQLDNSDINISYSFSNLSSYHDHNIIIESNEKEAQPIEAKKFEDENKTEIFTDLPDYEVEVEQKGDKVEIELEPKNINKEAELPAEEFDYFVDFDDADITKEEAEDIRNHRLGI